jgi:hypothetical protein
LTQIGLSAIGTSPFGHGFPLGLMLTQVLLTWEKAWFAPQLDGPGAEVVVGVVGVAFVVVGVVVDSLSVLITVVVESPPQAEIATASPTATINAAKAIVKRRKVHLLGRI